MPSKRNRLCASFHLLEKDLLKSSPKVKMNCGIPVIYVKIRVKIEPSLTLYMPHAWTSFNYPRRKPRSTMTLSFNIHFNTTEILRSSRPIGRSTVTHYHQYLHIMEMLQFLRTNSRSTILCWAIESSVHHCSDPKPDLSDVIPAAASSMHSHIN